MDTILWHDYETTGINPGQDRAVQFAAIRTNLELEQVDEPFTLYCQIPEDCVPSPYACLVTGISPQTAAANGLLEPEFVGRIYAEMMQPGTCSSGYNSIRFDDEVSRYSFYRNFFDPYAREWKNGNSRWDIIDMVRLVHLLRPETLNWPQNNDGSTSFRLELLTDLNGIEHGAAHDALSDVRATIDLARLIKDRQPKLYDHYWKLRRKNFVSQQLDITAHKPFLHVSSKFSSSRGCAAIMAPLVALKSNSNAFVAIDLGFDPEGLKNLNTEQLRERVFSKTEDLAEGVERIPLKLVHLNRSPVVLPASMLSDARAADFDIDLQTCHTNWNRLLSIDLEKIDFEQVFGFSGESASDAETALYQAFIPDVDRRLADSVRDMLPGEIRLADPQFQDKRLQDLLFRYRARNYPESLTEEERGIWEAWVRQKLIQGEPFGSPIDTVLKEIEQLLLERSEEGDQQVLKDLRIWLHNLRSKYAQA